jgi:hypothetical protein
MIIGPKVGNVMSCDTATHGNDFELRSPRGKDEHEAGLYILHINIEHMLNVVFYVLLVRAN